jgi:hypothetical protein
MPAPVPGERFYRGQQGQGNVSNGWEAVAAALLIQLNEPVNHPDAEPDINRNIQPEVAGIACPVEISIDAITACANSAS